MAEKKNAVTVVAVCCVLDGARVCNRDTLLLFALTFVRASTGEARPFYRRKIWLQLFSSHILYPFDQEISRAYLGTGVSTMKKRYSMVFDFLDMVTGKCGTKRPLW